MRFSLFLGLASVAVAVDPLVDLGYAKYQGQTLQNGVNQWLSMRFAAPVIGKNRFAAPQAPLPETVVQDSTKEGALCVSANNQEGLQFGSARQPMAEDCLFVAVYSPKNATETSNLPIMFFISGGGFNSNSNGNFNGTGLVEASGGNMIVVRANYRVGMLGFVSGTLIENDKNGAVSNNGMNDIVAALKWTQQFATKFGGDPKHIVVTGVSAGGNAIDLLVTANNGTGFPGLFVGAISESTGWGSMPNVITRDADLQKNINSTGCLNDPDPINCMRLLPIADFQNKTLKNGWGPTVDGKLFTAPQYQLMEQGKFMKIPIIYGWTSNEGTPDFISNQSATTDEDLIRKFKNNVPIATDADLQKLLQLYPDSLNQKDFFGRDVSVKNATLRKGSGIKWQQDATITTELKLACVAGFFSDMHSLHGNTESYHYRYNVLDSTPGGLADQGLFTPHVNEIYAVFGKNNTDGGDPKCLDIPFAQGGCLEGAKITQSYWMSFVRSLDPNKFRDASAPVWEKWTMATPVRVLLDTSNATMETTGAGVGEIIIADQNQRQRCNKFMLPFSKSINIGMSAGEKLPPFANGTLPDPNA
ncbi:hypothetical protein HYALB_00000899 [Hymenoscyphus albidus]|uniref:Carboxylic ester hydrolase n=1 Tax=Hymenoscyphus albidus TaxID=595503 RepID=A0A9N9PWR3_9HELO|nr:hypothetical protein HYALB_00000899 [Hymenoscyphus albidus]